MAFNKLKIRKLFPIKQKVYLNIPTKMKVIKKFLKNREGGMEGKVEETNSVSSFQDLINLKNGVSSLSHAFQCKGECPSLQTIGLI